MTTRSKRLGCAAAGLVPALGLLLASPTIPAMADSPAAVVKRQTAAVAGSDMYQGHVQVVRGAADDPDVLTGTVFDDRDRDSVHDDGEPGIAGVTVSNGHDVDTTGGDGVYELPVLENMTVFATQPAGFQVPVDEHRIAQFSYNHLPKGSPELEYGGIPATGPLPKAVNFPMASSEATASTDLNCPIAADTQVYDMTQVGYARDGAVADLVDRTDYGGCGALLLGDNVGDDLSLYPALKDIYADVNGPIRMAMGNHDMDYDAPDASHSVDTFRHQVGPAYFSYDVGNAHFVVLDSIEFPLEPGSTSYQERIDAAQLAWLEQDLANVARNKLVVVATHAPIVDHRDVIVDNAPELYEVLQGRPAVTIGGHTHMIENLRAGDQRAEWAEAGVDELPVPQLVAGAVSGDWYSGDLDEHGLPYAYMADGSRPGILTLEVDGNEFTESYSVRGESGDLQLALGVNTPHWREWAAETFSWREDGGEGDAPELGDQHLITEDDLDRDSWLTANFFAGSTDADVEVAIDGRAPVPAEHTQPMSGEELNSGWQYSDPAAATRNLLSDGSVTRSNAHLWRLPIPAGLEMGTHTARVTATDHHGEQFSETIRFTVAESR